MSDVTKLTKGQIEMLRKGVASAAVQECAADVIDAHAADRAALVAQLETAKALFIVSDNDRRKEWERAEALVVQVAELTRERDKAREGDGYWHAAAVAEGKAKLRAEGELRSQERATQQLSAEVARLIEALNTERAARVNQSKRVLELEGANKSLGEGTLRRESEVNRLTAALAAVQREAGEMAMSCVADLETLKNGTLARAEAAEARVRELVADRERSERDWTVFKAERSAEIESLRRAESECAALREAWASMSKAHAKLVDECEALRREADRLRNSDLGIMAKAYDHASMQRDTAEARVRELETWALSPNAHMRVKAEEAESKCAALRAQVQRLEGLLQQCTVSDTNHVAERDAAESECTALRRQNRADHDALSVLRRAAESRLANANANALLDELRAEVQTCEVEMAQRDFEDHSHIQADGYRHMRAHLAAQPATAPVALPAPGHTDLMVPPETLGRTDADQAALDILDQRVEYAIECGYVQHAAVRWLRDSVRTLRGLK